MFIAAAFALLAAAQPEPVDSDLSCVVDRIPAETRAAIIGEAISGTGGPVRQAFLDATAACARERSWNDAFSTGVGRIAMALVLGQEAETVLSQNGIEPQFVHDWFERQPDTIQRSEPSEETGTALILHLESQGIAMDRLQANAPTIGIMLGALNMIERIGAGLE